MKRFWLYATVAVVFLAIGIAGTLIYQSVTKSEPERSKAVVDSKEPVAETQPVVASPDPEAVSSEIGTSYGGGVSGGGSKFTILETQRIYADKTRVQTGETVNFFAKLKNTGTQKKFLTHICFQYSGGNFGCHLNTNLEAGKEISIHNSMIFPNPGTYSVWITWSQDKTNFYRPVNGGKATVTVY